MNSKGNIKGNMIVPGYKGRFVGAGLTGQARPYVLHAATARSEPNKQRKAVLLPPADTYRIFIKHLKPETIPPEQLAEIQYNAIRVAAEDYAVVSNGEQTDGIAQDAPRTTPQMLDGLGGYNYERDGTPRITIVVRPAALATPQGKELGSYIAHFGIVAKDLSSERKIVGSVARGLYLGRMYYITTYTGEGRDIVLPDVQNNDDLRILIRTTKMEGRTAQELSEEFYDRLNPDYVVCTDTAMWFEDLGEWQFGRKNLHGD